MYEPPHFREDRLGILHDLIDRYPFGLLVSSGSDGEPPLADGVPCLLDRGAGPLGCLRVHVARSNPHWKMLKERPNPPVLVIFQGPMSYVTPSWYETKRETGKVVPTWNYVMVQATGFATVHEDPEWLRRQVTALTGRRESSRAEPWAITDAPERYIAAQLNGIVGIEIAITAITGKWKVSQNRNDADRAGVFQGLETEGNRPMAALVSGKR